MGAMHAHFMRDIDLTRLSLAALHGQVEALSSHLVEQHDLAMRKVLLTLLQRTREELETRGDASVAARADERGAHPWGPGNHHRRGIRRSGGPCNSDASMSSSLWFWPWVRSS
jgi:hypothetical protein